MLKEIKRVKSKASSECIRNLHRFIEAHPTDESENIADELKNWVKSARQCEK